MTALVVALAVCVALLGLLVIGLLRAHADVLRSLHDLGAGLGDPAAPHGPVPFAVRGDLPAPNADPSDPLPADVAGTSPLDAVVSVAVAAVRHRTLLAFLSSGCLTCQDFWRAFRTPETLGLPADVRLLVVTKGPDEESPTAIRDLAPPGVQVVMSTEAWADYQVAGSPYLVLVDGPAGRVAGSGAATTWQQVRRLLDSALADAPDRPRLPLLRAGTGSRDNAERIDAELLRAGIGPDHPSLYQPRERP